MDQDRAAHPSQSDFQFRVEVPFGPRWQHVERLRLSILHCVTTVFESHDFCERLGMVTAELLENAIHYGDWAGRAARPFRLEVRGTGDSVIVDVANPIDPARKNDGRLEAAIALIRRAATVRDAYVARLREIAEAPERPGSGLGLLRIADETGCELDAHIDVGTARVVATIPRAPGE